MRTSSNYGFKLPEGTDNVKRQDLVDNFESIDVKMKAIESTGIPYGGTTTGVANTYAIATPTITALTVGLPISLKFNIASTGASTLNWCELGAKGIKKPNGSDATNLKIGIYTLRYDGTNFILQGEGASGNAIASDLLPGKTASTDLGDIEGTMLTKTAATYTPSTLAQTISALQYLLGPQTIAGDADLISANIRAGVSIFGVAGKSTVVDTADATIAASQMITGYTGYVNGSKVTGAMPYVNPDYSDQRLTTGVVVGASSGDGQNYAYTAVPNGNFLNGINWFRSLQPYLLSQYIISGASIFGVAGTATIASLGGKRYAIGSVAAGGSTTISLPFTPTVVYATYSSGGSSFNSIQWNGLIECMKTGGNTYPSSGITITTNSFTFNDYGKGFSWRAYE